MAPVAGHVASLSISGVAVPVIDEPTSVVSSGVFQVTSLTRRVFAPDAAVTIKDGGGATLSPSTYTFNHLFGIVTFSSSAPVACTVSGSYLPMRTVGLIRAVDLKVSGDLSDTSVMGSAYKQKAATLADFTIGIETLQMPLEDLDSGESGIQSVDSILRSGTPKLLEVLFGAYRFRGWCVFEDYFVKASTAALVEVSTNAIGSAQNGVSFAWGQ